MSVKTRLKGVDIMNSNDITVKQEILREGAWGILAKIDKLSDKYPNEIIYDKLSEKLYHQIEEIQDMNLKEMEDFFAVIRFLRQVTDKL